MADDGQDLQFDRAEAAEEGAEPERTPPTCVACSQPLSDVYWDINGQAACQTCKDDLTASLTGGSGTLRFLRALGRGLVAGALGAILYYAILRITGFELSLLSIVVGVMVGKAVRTGSDARGGGFYQGLAVVVTYLAIVSCYIPFIVEGLREQFRDRGYVGAPAAAPGTPAAGESAAAKPPAGKPALQPKPAAPGTAAPAPEPRAPTTLGGRLLALALALVFLLAIACAAPFLGGMGNVMQWVIIGIGLYQAWHINRKPVIEITGPLRLNVETPLAAPDGG